MTAVKFAEEYLGVRFRLYQKILLYWMTRKLDREKTSCSGCNHLVYNSGGGAECAIGLGRICPRIGFHFRREK